MNDVLEAKVGPHARIHNAWRITNLYDRAEVKFTIRTVVQQRQKMWA